MTSRVRGMLAIGAVLVMPAMAEGQSTPPPVRHLTSPARKPAPPDDVPESYLPPAGMCRIWINNVPPVQQPAPTDCASAIKNRPSNGRVIFPEDGGRGSRSDRDKGDKGEPGEKGEEGSREKDSRRKDAKPKRP